MLMMYKEMVIDVKRGRSVASKSTPKAIGPIFVTGLSIVSRRNLHRIKQIFGIGDRDRGFGAPFDQNVFELGRY